MKQTLTTEQIEQIAESYRGLTDTSVSVIKFLQTQKDGTFIGGFRDLARTLGNKQPKNSSNYSKACKVLEKYNIIRVHTSDAGRPKSIALNPGWVLGLMGE